MNHVGPRNKPRTQMNHLIIEPHGPSPASRNQNSWFFFLKSKRSNGSWNVSLKKRGTDRIANHDRFSLRKKREKKRPSNCHQGNKRCEQTSCQKWHGILLMNPRRNLLDSSHKNKRDTGKSSRRGNKIRSLFFKERPG